MALCYSISTAHWVAGFIFYCIVKIRKGKAKEVHPIPWWSPLCSSWNFILLALI